MGLKFNHAVCKRINTTQDWNRVISQKTVGELTPLNYQFLKSLGF